MADSIGAPEMLGLIVVIGSIMAVFWIGFFKLLDVFLDRHV